MSWRALRIAPALIAAVLVCAFLLGPAMTILPLSDYFRDPQLWRFIQATLTTLKSTAPLPGVFTESPFHFPLGTVWTLKYEVICYAVVLALGVAGALRHRVVVLALVTGLVAASLWLDFLHPEAGKGTQTSIRLPLIFLGGSLLYLYRQHVPFNPLIAVGLLRRHGLLRARRFITHCSFWRRSMACCGSRSAHPWRCACRAQTCHMVCIFMAGRCSRCCSCSFLPRPPP